MGREGCTCTVVKLLTRRGSKGEMRAKGREKRSVKKEEERVCETMINGYLCALSHYNVHVHVHVYTGVNVTIMLLWTHTQTLQ